MCGTSFSNLSLSFTALPIEMFFLTNAEFIDVGRRTQGGALPPWGAPQAHMSRLPGQKCIRLCGYLRHCWYINYLVYQLELSGAYTNNSKHQRRHCPLFRPQIMICCTLAPDHTNSSLKIRSKVFLTVYREELDQMQEKKTENPNVQVSLVLNFQFHSEIRWSKYFP